MREGSILFVICSSFLNIQVFYCYTILTPCHALSPIYLTSSKVPATPAISSAFTVLWHVLLYEHTNDWTNGRIPADGMAFPSKWPEMTDKHHGFSLVIWTININVKRSNLHVMFMCIHLWIHHCKNTCTHKLFLFRETLKYNSHENEWHQTIVKLF